MAQSKRILVVDDEPISLRVITATLDLSPYEVEQCESGETAWALLQQDPGFDVIILDRIMPGLDGMALFEKIQADDSLKSIPIIMLTAVDGEEEIIEAITAGVFDYLTKPVDSERLLQLVESATQAR